MKQFMKYLAGFFYRPSATIAELASDRHVVLHGLSAMLLISILYSFASLALYLSPNECCLWEPLVKVSEEDYWLVQIVWEIPLMFALAVVPAALTELLTDRVRRESDFKVLFAGMSFILFTVQFFNMWLPEFLMAFVGYDFLPPLVGAVRVWMFIPWGIFLLAVIVRHVKQMSGWRAGVISTVSFLPSVMLALLFVR